MFELGSTKTVDRGTDQAFSRYQAGRRELWDAVAEREEETDLSGYYHRRLETIYRTLVQSDSEVLEIGSGKGDLLAALHPSRGVGVDFSPAMVQSARNRHPGLEFELDDAHNFQVEGQFDYVVLSDLLNDVWDVQAVLDRVRGSCTPNTRVIINSFNRVWQVPLGVARRLGLAKPLKRQNWLSVADLRNLLEMAGFEVISVSGEIIMPVRIPLMTSLMNRFLVKLWPFNHLGLTQFIVARPIQDRDQSETKEESTVSVVVPARNEAGHIRDIVARLPQLGSSTELIFVEGNSTDDTYEEIQRTIEESSAPNIYLYRQPGKGKGDAVRYGFEHASGEILMILDADMTVAPEELPRFYRAIVDGHGEFANGVRLVYPMENEAMRFLNYLGNKFFGVVFSWILRQPVKDTLCGTKVLTREAYDSIVANRSYFGDFDPFGDFDLLFGAARLHLKIVDVPIRYRDRAYGSTNIDRWRHGWLLLKMAGFAARRLRFI